MITAFIGDRKQNFSFVQSVLNFRNSTKVCVRHAVKIFECRRGRHICRARFCGDIDLNGWCDTAGKTACTRSVLFKLIVVITKVDNN